MRVEKWYLDCVADDGTGMIGYAARVSWGPLAVRCSETLHWRAGDLVARCRIALGGRLPVSSPDGVAWSSPALQARGRWRPPGYEMPPAILHEEAAGRIEWNCLCPAAPAAVGVNGDHFEGFGYAERLVMTLPADRLPMRELRWGRFISRDESCVWIRWRGPVERNWCYHNGQAVDAVMPDFHQLEWSGHRLKLSRGTTLRTGRIADTAFNEAGLLRRLLPAAVLDLEETKWCSPGVLIDAHGRDHAGWAIHEVAIFP